MRKTINILGSCVSRDTFGMFENDGGFEIRQCVTNSGIYSLCSPKLSEEHIASEEDFPRSGHYFQRCAVLDMNKTVFDYLHQKDSDYVMVDLANMMSKPVMKVQMKEESDADNFTYITRTQAISGNPDFLEKAPFRVLDTFWAFDDEFTMIAFIYRYAEILREQFDPKKIILVEVKPMERYIDSEGNIKLFSENSKVAKKTRYLSEAYSIMEQALPEAHVIKFPDVEVLCNANHKWGIDIFHYISEYYSYVLDSVKAIACSDSRESEKIMLKSIKGLYQQLIRERYADTVNGQYPLKNTSFISSKSVRLGEPVMVCLNAEGGTGKYHFDVYIRKKYEKKWTLLETNGNSSLQYEPQHFAAYELCVKMSDENNVAKKEYFEFVVH